MSNPDYVLGHADREIERLKAQSRLIGPATRRFFDLAGIGPGMHLMDVGSGAGDVAILAADIVGPAGSVTGVDIAATAVAQAQSRIKALGLTQVSFRHGDPAELMFDRPFDAIVGRYVLLFQADASMMLRRLAKHLRPGGVIVFHEPDWSFIRSTPPAPLYDRCCRRIVDVFDRSDTNTNMSAKLYRVFVGAGLPPPVMRMETLIGGSEAAADWITAVAELTIVLLPTMQRLGIVTTGDNTEMAADTLAERLRHDVAAADSVIVGRAEIGAWSRV
jgi:ubiquinone/menaquinone biosynthesis C-methylase UbiE